MKKAQLTAHSVWRCEEGGWQLCAMNDPTGRRGIWMRVHHSDKPTALSILPLTRLEVCGGREGDDEYVTLSVGDVVTLEKLQALEGVFTRAAWVLDVEGDSALPQELLRRRKL